ncbi:MAG: hypothetical protein A3E87_03790 [Gammaproteobacteria bacterium RIFCSPHIGHO2_12_FULL_35_23]|nr:MAG: hypothetical protein A3E87_03790 [Gammaproteobacteria bacterium RIFCSPHIGHO2_12_FULL_35_23]
MPIDIALSEQLNQLASTWPVENEHQQGAWDNLIRFLEDKNPAVLEIKLVTQLVDRLTSPILTELISYLIGKKITIKAKDSAVCAKLLRKLPYDRLILIEKLIMQFPGLVETIIAPGHSIYHGCNISDWLEYTETFFNVLKFYINKYEHNRFLTNSAKHKRIEQGVQSIIGPIHCSNFYFRPDTRYNIYGIESPRLVCRIYDKRDWLAIAYLRGRIDIIRNIINLWPELIGTNKLALRAQETPFGDPLFREKYFIEFVQAIGLNRVLRSQLLIKFGTSYSNKQYAQKFLACLRYYLGYPGEYFKDTWRETGLRLEKINFRKIIAGVKELTLEEQKNLVHYVLRSPTSMLYEKLSDCAKEIIRKIFIDYMISSHAIKVSTAVRNMNKYFRIEIMDSGNCEDTYTHTLKILLEKYDEEIARDVLISKDILATEFRTQLSASISERKSVAELLEHLAVREWNLHRFLGRTIILKHPTENRFIAIKIQKQLISNHIFREFTVEPADELFAQYKTVKFFTDNKSPLGLKSTLPTAKYAGYVEGNLLTYFNVGEALATLPGYSEFITLVGDLNRPDLAIYCYEADASYFKYLHEHSDENPLQEWQQFCMASENACYDLYTLFLRLGIIYNRLADIFHNTEHQHDRDDKGRYQVLTSLMRVVRNIKGNKLRSGLGRLTGWLKAVEYPNLRLSGFADEADYKRIEDYFSTDTLETVTSALYSNSGQISTAIILNSLTEYLFVFFLTTGRRAREIYLSGKLETEEARFALWYSAAEHIIKLSAIATVTLISGTTLSEIQQYYLSIINIERLAKQMRYWMTRDHVSGVLSQIIPADIFSEEVEVIFGELRKGTWHKVEGHCLNGKDADLGAVNGQMPIKELDELVHAFAATIAMKLIAQHKERKLVQTLQTTTPTRAQIANYYQELKQSGLCSKEILSLLSASIPEDSYVTADDTTTSTSAASSTAAGEVSASKVEENITELKKAVIACKIQDFWRKNKAKKAERSRGVSTSLWTSSLSRPAVISTLVISTR